MGNQITTTTDIVLVGGGIMSATLAVFLRHLEPELEIHIFERRKELGRESSDALNNAGTGHSALCELNYTPYKDGNVDTSKPDKIIEMFEQSKQFRSYLVKKGALAGGNSFINWVPHMSLVFGEDDVTFLKKRYQKMTQNPLFADMEYSEQQSTLEERFPLMMNGRNPSQKMAATRSELGTDVNFGQLTRDIFTFLSQDPQVHIHTQHEVTTLHQTSSHREIAITNRQTNIKNNISAQFVFLGSGGMAIPLLAKSGIHGGKKYGGFPVDGQRLICNNPDIVEKHHGKVYGKAAVGAPPMSVPHLDTRVIDGKRSLLFGPYAGFTTKFLKQGHRYDLFASLHPKNIFPMLQVGWRNRGLTKYLIGEALQSKKDRMTSLRTYYPGAKDEDRYLSHAGKRVQIIKDDPEQGGILQFGTEVVVSEDKTLTALLGASPGASTAVSIMLELLEKTFPKKITTDARQNKLKEMIPSYGILLREDRQLANKVREETHKVLGLSEEAFNKNIG